MRRSGALRYALLAALVAGITAVGYLGYVVYPRFDLPAGTGAGLLLLAVGAGVASFFSPCSFPLLVSILGRPPEGAAGVAPAARFALALSLGAAAFVLLAGAGIAAGGAAVFGEITFASPAGVAIRAAVGVLLILLGLVQLGRLPVSFRRFEPVIRGVLGRQAQLRRRRPFAGYVLFGFVYLLAGFG